MQIHCSTHSVILCDGHAVHMLSHWRLPSPLTSTVKSSLFMHVHSSPLSLAARVHQCHSNCSCNINNGWAFSTQTLHIYLYSLLRTYCSLLGLSGIKSHAFNMLLGYFPITNCIWELNFPYELNSNEQRKCLTQNIIT